MSGARYPMGGGLVGMSAMQIWQDETRGDSGMSGEKEIHNGFIAYLRKNGLSYSHHRMDRKSGIAVGFPDFCLVHCNRALLIEVKTPKGKLSSAQDDMIAKLAKNGTVTRVCRSVEDCVRTVEWWMGVISKDLPSSQEIGLTTGSDSSADGRSRVQTGGYVPAGQSLSEMQKADRLRRKTRMTLRLPESEGGQNNLSGSKSQPAGKVDSEKVEPESRTSGVVAPPAQNLFIANIAGVDWVCKGSGQPGTEAERIRRATPADLINIR